MAEYELSPAAERDLLEIAIYTISTWSAKQADQYAAALERHFVAIGRGSARARVLLEHRPELLVSRCEHHYVFFVKREQDGPLILAVLHEDMDLMAQVRDRSDAPPTPPPVHGT